MYNYTWVWFSDWFRVEVVCVYYFLYYCSFINFADKTGKEAYWRFSPALWSGEWCKRRRSGRNTNRNNNNNGVVTNYNKICAKDWNKNKKYRDDGPFRHQTSSSTDQILLHRFHQNIPTPTSFDTNRTP